jgi:hypothetical protein
MLFEPIANLFPKRTQCSSSLTALLTVSLAVASLPLVNAATNEHSIARIWDERALAAIRVDTPHPPAQARNYFSLSVCMYDAWAAYDTNRAVGYVYRGKHFPPAGMDVATARREAISYAAYRLLLERHVYSRTAATTLAADHALMTSLGYDTNNVSRDVSTPAGVGNSVYDAVSAWFINDGSRQTNGVPYPLANPPVAYPDFPSGQGGYVYVNDPLPAGVEGIVVKDLNHWQRLQIVNAVDQNGFPQGPIQNYLGAQWLGVRPFALSRSDSTKPWLDPGPPPFFGGPTHAAFVEEIVQVIRASSQLTTDDGFSMDISPAVCGNNSLGDVEGEFPHIYDGRGHTNNPVTGQPYAPNVVKRGDYARALAEFWADGPNSETPPGHWNVVANDMSDSPFLEKRIGGTGPIVDDLEWDVKLYFALNAAVHEGGCLAWAVKRAYDGWRPMSGVRYLGQLGQSSDPTLPSYHTNGLPLITNLIELVTPQTSAAGQKHEGLTPGKIAVLAWPGETPQRTAPNGVRWLHAEAWTTYQRTNFVVPGFPGYVSGHSTFSRCAAEVLTAFTGSPYFPGGIATYTITNLVNELGPSQPIELRYATYYDAADGAGLSRIWGGIHPPIDNLMGRRTGAQAGKAVWELAKKYFDGTVTDTPVSIERRGTNQYQIQYNTVRGLYYKLQSTSDLSQSFVDDPPSVNQPFDALTIVRTNVSGGSNRFHRAVGSLTP